MSDDERAVFREEERILAQEEVATSSGQSATAKQAVTEKVEKDGERTRINYKKRALELEVERDKLAQKLAELNNKAPGRDLPWREFTEVLIKGFASMADNKNEKRV